MKYSPSCLTDIFQWEIPQILVTQLLEIWIQSKLDCMFRHVIFTFAHILYQADCEYASDQFVGHSTFLAWNLMLDLSS